MKRRKKEALPSPDISNVTNAPLTTKKRLGALFCIKTLNPP